MESESKELQLAIEQIDRISELPDSILSKILSYLPTKYAFGASILSTRWKNLLQFEFMPNKLALDDSLLFNPREENSGSFRDFVDRLLNETLSGAHSVEEILVKCDNRYGENKVMSWVSAAGRLNVRHLDLKFSINESTTFFHSLNGCTTLVTLRLWVESRLLLPDSFILPHLKSLDLAKLTFNDEEDAAFNRLMEGCPALEYLYLFQCSLTYWGDVCIKSPLLKKLVIESCWVESLSDLILDTPNLEVLIYDAFLACRYLGCDFNRLRMAHIDIRPSQELLDFLGSEGNEEDLWYFNNSTTMIVCRCSSTICLYLSDCAIDALYSSSMQLPLFRNLKCLSLGRLRWSILACLLQIAPNLEHLIVEKGFQENEEGFADFRNLLPVRPECFALNMRRIEFQVFKGDENEMKLVEYFLKNGEVLENLILHCLPLDDMSIFTRLLTLPRQSKTCLIQCKMKQEAGL